MRPGTLHDLPGVYRVCRLTLRHDRLATEEGRELTRAGWSGCLDALETLHPQRDPENS